MPKNLIYGVIIGLLFQIIPISFHIAHIDKVISTKILKGEK